MMRRARARAVAGSWRLPLIVLIGVLAAGALAALYGGLNGRPADDAAAVTMVTRGTVIRSEPCATAGARDTVRVEVDGAVLRLPINACGNPIGFQLDVELVSADPGAEPTARVAGTGGQPGSTVADRISAVLLVLAGLAGAALVMQLAPQRRRPPARHEATRNRTTDPAVPAGPGRNEPSPTWSDAIEWPTEPAEPADPDDPWRPEPDIAWPGATGRPAGAEPAANGHAANGHRADPDPGAPAIAWPTEEPTEITQRYRLR